MWNWWTETHVLLQCFVVSTLVSMMPANPFIFRNYELPPKDVDAAQQVSILTVARASSERVHEVGGQSMYCLLRALEMSLGFGCRSKHRQAARRTRSGKQ